MKKLVGTWVQRRRWLNKSMLLYGGVLCLCLTAWVVYACGPAPGLPIEVVYPTLVASPINTEFEVTWRFEDKDHIYYPNPFGGPCLGPFPIYDEPVFNFTFDDPSEVLEFLGNDIQRSDDGTTWRAFMALKGTKVTDGRGVITPVVKAQVDDAARPFDDPGPVQADVEIIITP